MVIIYLHTWHMFCFKQKAESRKKKEETKIQTIDLLRTKGNYDTI